MRATTVLAIIFVPLIIGALIPFAFGRSFGGVISENMICSTLDSAKKRGYLDPAARKKLMDEALKAPNLDAKTRAAIEGASKGC